LLPYRGVNLASAEFGPESEGVYGTDYVYPIPAYVEGYDSPAYYVNKGMNTFRLPFLWERLQPTLDGAFDATELERLTTTVDYLTSMSAHVIVDPHNYARYSGDIIGSSAVPSASFADFWSRLADQFRSNPYVVFGVMNEPHDMDVSVWVTAANAAIAAIRDTGATNLVLVPGSRWTGAHSWYNSDLDGAANSSALLDIYDSGDNMAVEVHQYLDAEMSGTESTCQSATIGSESLYNFTGWLTTYGMHGFLGEFGGGANATCQAAIDDILNYLEAYSDVWVGWTYWAGGPIWPVDYMTSLEPSGDADTAQMDTLEPHLNADPEPPATDLPIDATGWVPASSNAYGIQGPWYWYSDADKYGLTDITNVAVGALPFEPGVGMCLHGTTPGGYYDDYDTWGAVIALNLNQATADGTPGVLVNGPTCYRITVTGDAPAGLRAKLAPQSPLEPTLEAPGIDIIAGTSEVCLDNVSEADWCATTTKMTCLSPDSLINGAASLSVQGSAGDYGGTIDFCVTAVVAHD
jgi:endoglucanase